MAKDNKMTKAQQAAQKKAKYLYLERWDTRFGQSDRIVIRNQGRFVDNITRKQLAGAQPVS
jgi:hypothetical protein